MSSLQHLVGIPVERIEVVEDYFQVVLVDGTLLSIFNKCVFQGDSILGMRGMVVSSVEESDELVVVRFESGESLAIGLRDEDYNGPEAMQLNQVGKPTVVWG